LKYSWDFVTEVCSGDEEFIVEVRFYGYYDSGVSWGPVENSYPEEGDDEFEIIRVRVYDDTRLRSTIVFDECTVKEQKIIEKLFLPLIESKDFEKEKKNCAQGL